VQGCRDCPPDPVDAARSPFLYAGPVRSALHRLKFGGLRAVAEALGRAMATVATDVAGEAGIVTWVPVSRIRLARRGYDQARALAAVVCGQLGLPRARLLLRPTEIGPQARRSGPERRGALRGAFVSSGRDPPATVLLVDDVLTTGATAAECAEVLGAAGARRVVLLTAARSLSGRLPARCYSDPDSRPSLWLPGDRPR
jgi:predicted amidophosphoribosyltransferase